VTAFAGAATVGLYAQQASSASPSAQGLFYAQSDASTTPLFALNEMPTDADALSYSSSAGASETLAAEDFHFNAPGAAAALTSSTQPPPRRYGRRPVYADSSHNADGSNKYTFFGGAGFTLPTGGTHAYDTTSYNFQVGGGRQFNKNLALLAQFDYARFGVQTNTLNDLLKMYQNLCGEDCTGSPISEIGGSTHIWSFTVDPMYSFMGGEKSGAYVIGGVGYYHKVTNITTPGQQSIYDPYYGYITYDANVAFDTYVSNAVGVNGGVGFTYKPSRFGNEKFYAEARYVYTANSRRPLYDGIDGTNPTSNPNYFNVFPQNSAPTTFIPVTFGVRF
jgi:hypothetical protein